jgi:hypothetical protein
MQVEDAIFGDEIFILEQQSLIDEARYVRQQPHPFVVAHGEGTSYAVWRTTRPIHCLTIRSSETSSSQCGRL